VERMNEAFNSLQTVSHKMAEALYQQSGSQPGGETTEQSSAAGASSSGGGDDNVIDAEYVDVDEEKK
jgi:molecular chaperone DnaK